MNGRIDSLITKVAGSAFNKQWSAKPEKKIYNMPKWARFRMFIQYDGGNAKYPSWDYSYKIENGFKIKVKSESIGLSKLIEEQHRQVKACKSIRYVNIFANLSNDLDTTTGNFDYLICTIVKGAINWKNPIYWREDNSQMLDVKRMNEERFLNKLQTKKY